MKKAALADGLKLLGCLWLLDFGNLAHDVALNDGLAHDHWVVARLKADCAAKAERLDGLGDLGNGPLIVPRVALVRPYFVYSQ